MDFTQYLNDIPALIMTAIAALGGTATGIGVLFSSICKVIKGLKAGKTDYESKANDYEVKSKLLQERSEQLSATAATFEQFGEVLTAFGENFDRLTKQSDANGAKFDTLASVLLLIAENTPALVQNGTAKAVKRLLAPDSTDNTIAEIAERGEA